MLIKIKLKELLQINGLTAHDLALKTKISDNAISSLCNNKVKGIKFDTLKKICSELKCDIQDILEKTA